MAGSDKKEQQLRSNESVSGGAQPLIVQDPDVSHFVLPGTPIGLIPRVKLNTDLTTTITTWPQLPDPGDTEHYRLQIARAGSSEWAILDEHSYTGGDTWVPLDFTISSTFLLDPTHEGPFDLRYEHENFVGIKDWSNRVRIQIDKVPPNGAAPPQKMIFTITPPITDPTFGANDFLEATIPLWEGGELIDVKVAYAWLKGELPEDPTDIPLIPPQDIVPGGKVRIPKDKFIEAGDGLCCGGYVLIDKAGNISALSLYELMSVALDPLPPAPLPKPTVADATGGELRREDIVNGGVLVNVPQVDKGKSTDTLVIKWKDQELKPGTPVGGNPANGIDIFVPWSMIRSAYGSATGPIDIPVSYTCLRGVEPFVSEIETLICNLSNTGPGNPDPNPGNPALKKVRILGKSNVENVIIKSDEDEDIVAEIELVAPLADGDTYGVKWNGTSIGVPYVIDVANDKAGDIIKIALDWDVIRGEGPSAAMPVWYELSNPAHANPQEPDPRTAVQIDFLVLELPEAIAQHVNPSGIVTCNSLRWNSGATSYGIEYLIPPSTHLKAGDDVDVEWKGYTSFASPVLVPAAGKKHTFTNITEVQARDGIIWLIEPYATHLLPIWSSTAQTGKGEVTYTIKGKPAASTPTNTRVVLSQGEGSCNIPDKP
ncbi:hypothetical protein [Pseudomonas moorei]|uniref:hypothetical protein n=1 Tax=Pseudomonas moorei TaxID=395599 RepID=UPI001FF64241|nr:hypothetical protein [Pseudomonas moorei]